MLRFGEIIRVIREPGIYFKIPTSFVDTVQIIENRLLSFDLEDIRVQVRDGRRYMVDAFVAFKITDPRKFRENVSGSLDIARENMRTRLDAALRRVYGQRSFEAALSEQRGDMMLRGARAAAAALHPGRHRDRRRPHQAHRSSARGLAADLRAHEGGASGGSRRSCAPRGTELAARIAPKRRPRSGRDGRRGGTRGGDPARPGRGGARPRLRGGLSAGSRLLRVLPLHAAPTSTSLDGSGTSLVLSPDSEFLRLLPMLPDTRRAAAAGRRQRRGAAAKGRPVPAPRSRRRQAPRSRLCARSGGRAECRSRPAQ